jgi:long-chain acyl-CoA synthetase
MEEGKNIYSVFENGARIHGDKTAVIYLGTKYTYKNLYEMTQRFAAALVDMGIKPRQTVMVYIPNSIQWVVAWLGIQRAGAYCVPITPIYTPSDLTYIANDVGAETIICADTNFGYVTRICNDTSIKRIIYTNIVDLLPWWKRSFGYLLDVVPTGKVSREENVYSFRDLLQHKKEPGNDKLPELAQDPDEMAEMLYTGGTTKHPKGVPISHGNFLTSAIAQIRITDVLFPADQNISLANSPLFHILGQTTSLSTILVGGTLMIFPKVGLDATFDAIQRFKVKSMVGVPTLYRMMLEHDRLDQYDLSSVQYWFSAGDLLPVEVGIRWKEKIGKPISQGYGATETCGGVSMPDLSVEIPPDSVGRIMKTKKVKIVDSITLEPLAKGETGELIVSSPYMVTYYHNKPEETEESFVRLDGALWYRTADIMKIDEQDNVYFIDRTVDTIKHKGYRISSSEIEAVLQEHPAVLAACVIGVEDSKVGERIKAFVVLKEDIKGITGYELIKWCRTKLVSYKIPQYIEFRDMLPKSKVGKLLKREMRT